MLIEKRKDFFEVSLWFMKPNVYEMSLSPGRFIQYFIVDYTYHKKYYSSSDSRVKINYNSK